MCYIICDIIQYEKSFLKWSYSVKIAGKHGLDYSRKRMLCNAKHKLFLILNKLENKNFLHIPDHPDHHWQFLLSVLVAASSERPPPDSTLHSFHLQRALQTGSRLLTPIPVNQELNKHQHFRKMHKLLSQNFTYACIYRKIQK